MREGSLKGDTDPTPLGHWTHPVNSPQSDATNSIQQGRHAAARRAIATIAVATYWFGLAR